MAELGQTLDARELVPGDVAAIEANVLAVRGRGEALASAGEGLNRIDSEAWVGAAGDAFRDEFGYEPRRWFTAADAFSTAASKLAEYAGTLGWAQEQAGEAIRGWEQAGVATDAARAAHEQDTRAGLPRGFPPVTVVPFTDPGAAQREQAVHLLARAREELAAAGAGAAAAIRDAAEQAPKESRWDKFFGGLGDAAGLVGNVGLGLWDGLAGTAEFLWELSPHHLFQDPGHYGELWDGLVAAADLAYNDTGTFFKEMVNWDLWATNPGRALGNTLFGFIPIVGVVAKVKHMRKIADRDSEDAETRSGEAEDGPHKGFTSPDAHVAEAANAIEEALPGRVLSVNSDVVMSNGLLRKVDVDLGDIVVQVKEGNARGLTGQMAATAASTDRLVVGYAPDIPNNAWENAARQGMPIARTPDELVAIIKELG